VVYLKVRKEIKMYEDKSIRISAGSYKILTDLKKVSGRPIKRIISDLLTEKIFFGKGSKNEKRK
jgi:hypothetical protein